MPFYLFGKTITPPSYYLPRASKQTITRYKWPHLVHPVKSPCPVVFPKHDERWRWSLRDPNLARFSCSSIFFLEAREKQVRKHFHYPRPPRKFRCRAALSVSSGRLRCNNEIMKQDVVSIFEKPTLAKPHNLILARTTPSFSVSVWLASHSRLGHNFCGHNF